uniref:Uncharacterized protein n=1 Tax=Helianthus annuus TaxID=4232 RepID=A0A251TC67_HELAN
MENFTRSLSKSLSRSVSSSVDRNKVWRRTAYSGFDGRRSVKTVRLGDYNHDKFWKIKNMFNFNKSKNMAKILQRLIDHRRVLQAPVTSFKTDCFMRFIRTCHLLMNYHVAS